MREVVMELRWRWSAECALALMVRLSACAAAYAWTSDRSLRAFIGSGRRVHLVLAGGREIVPAADAEQVDVESLLVSQDGTAAGWLAVYPNPGTSYPIPLKLMVWSHRRLRAYTGRDLPVWRWRFVGQGRQVAFYQETVHGGMGTRYELRDVASGRLRGEWEPGRGAPPTWVDGLRPLDEP